MASAVINVSVRSNGSSKVYIAGISFDFWSTSVCAITRVVPWTTAETRWRGLVVAVPEPRTVLPSQAMAAGTPCSAIQRSKMSSKAAASLRCKARRMADSLGGIYCPLKRAAWRVASCSWVSPRAHSPIASKLVGATGGNAGQRNGQYRAIRMANPTGFAYIR